MKFSDNHRRVSEFGSPQMQTPRHSSKCKLLRREVGSGEVKDTNTGRVEHGAAGGNWGSVLLGTWNIPQLPTQWMRKLATDSLQPWAESFSCGCCPLALPVCLKGSQRAALVE